MITNDLVWERIPKRKPMLIMLDGKRLRYASFSIKFSSRFGDANTVRHWADKMPIEYCILSWVNKAGSAYSISVKYIDTYAMVRKSGRLLTCFCTDIVPVQSHLGIVVTYALYAEDKNDD